jgi:hypothetical protein
VQGFCDVWSGYPLLLTSRVGQGALGQVGFGVLG